MSAPDIFLSYNREDAARAKHFADAFAAEGLDVWWDVALRSGEAYDKVTEAALRGAKAVVVLWSPRSVLSRWVRAEATLADRNKTLMPAMIEPCERPIMFELVQTAELSHWHGDGDKVWREFLAEVCKFIGKQVTPAAPAAEAKAASQSDADYPVVALLPFAVRAGDDELEMIAEDLADEIAAAMAHERWLKVIGSSVMARYRDQQIDHRKVGRELGARYLLQGKVQRLGANVRLNLQLVEAETANILWSDKFNGSADDLQQVDSELIARAEGQLPETIFQCEMMRAVAKSSNISAWERFLRASFNEGRLSSLAGKRAEEELRLALESSPNFAFAHAGLANLAMIRRYYPGVLALMAESEMRSHMQRALEVDGNDSFILRLAAFGPAAIGDSEGAVRLARRAVSLIPNSWHANFTLGHCLFAAGDLSGALDAFATEGRLAPNNGLRYYSESVIGLIHLLQGDLDLAGEAVGKALAYHPSFTHALTVKALLEAQQGRTEQALAAIRQLRASEPAMSVDNHAEVLSWLLRNKAAGNDWIESLRKLWEAAG